MLAAVGVLGSGSWGTALGVHLARHGHDVRLWARKPAFATELAAARENRVYLPRVPLPPSLKPTGSFEEACHRADMVLFVCPSTALRELAEGVRPFVSGGPLVVSAVKGVEQESLLTMSAVIERGLGDERRARVAVLSGPSFAREVGEGVPTAV